MKKRTIRGLARENKQLKRKLQTQNNNKVISVLVVVLNLLITIYNKKN